MIVLKVNIILFFVSVFIIIICVHARPIAKRSDLRPVSYGKASDVSKINHPSQSSIHDPMSLVTDSSSSSGGDDDENAYQINKDLVLHHSSLYVVGDEGQRSKKNLKYGVTNIGSRQHRYGESIWSPKPDQTTTEQQQEKKSNINSFDNSNSKSNANNYYNSNSDNDNSSNNINNNKPVPRRKEKSLTGIENQGRLLDSVPPLSSTKENEDNIVALDKHGQLHTLALPMTILPAT